MPIAHERKRHCIELLLKKMKFSPVVSIQGSRQVGKSYLARQIAPQYLKDTKYVTLDHKEIRQFAQENPHSFLVGQSVQHFIIDEVQKAPDLFDEIKALVDKDRRPGQFLILGSTEFSHETQIKESLTGRLSRIRIFPLSLAETLKLELSPQKNFPFISNKPRVSRRDLLVYLQRGGLPGIFIVKNDSERKSLISDWLRLTMERDIFQIKKYKLDSEIAYRIIEKIAVIGLPTLNQISKELGISIKKLQSYIQVFKNLFIIFEVKPFKLSSGKSLFYVTDLGILEYLKSDFEKKITTWIYLELMSQLSYKGYDNFNFSYYKTNTSSSQIHLLYEVGGELYACKFIFNESFDKRDYLIFENFLKKYQDQYKKIHVFAFYGGKSSLKHNDIKIEPWEALA